MIKNNTSSSTIEPVKFLKLLCGILFFLTTSLACDLNGDLWGNASAPIDGVAPVITSILPSSGNIRTDGTITITFSEQLDEATVTADTVYIVSSGDTTVHLPVSIECSIVNVSNPCTQVTVTYTDFIENLTYTITAAGSISDLKGNSMGTDRARIFTVVLPAVTSDTVSPISSQGASGFTFVFSEAMLSADNDWSVLAEVKNSTDTEWVTWQNLSSSNAVFSWTDSAHFVLTLTFPPVATGTTLTTPYDLRLTLSKFKATDNTAIGETVFTYRVEDAASITAE